MKQITRRKKTKNPKHNTPSDARERFVKGLLAKQVYEGVEKYHPLVGVDIKGGKNYKLVECETCENELWISKNLVSGICADCVINMCGKREK